MPFRPAQSIFMMFTVLIPPLRTYLGGWENFTPDEGRTWELIGGFLLDPVSGGACKRGSGRWGAGLEA